MVTHTGDGDTYGEWGHTRGVGTHTGSGDTHGEWRHKQGVGIHMRSGNTDGVGIHSERGYRTYTEKGLTWSGDTYGVKIYIKR